MQHSDFCDQYLQSPEWAAKKEERLMIGAGQQRWHWMMPTAGPGRGRRKNPVVLIGRAAFSQFLKDGGLQHERLAAGPIRTAPFRGLSGETGRVIKT